METVLKCVIAAVFGLSVIGKITGKTAATFDKAGYSPLFMYAIAVAECVLSIGLFTAFNFWSIKETDKKKYCLNPRGFLIFSQKKSKNTPFFC